MKKMSVRTKITLWFAVALLLVVFLSYAVVLYSSNQVIQKTIRDYLITTVESNIDEIEYFESIDDTLLNDVDYFIPYNDGYLEVDDDFLDEVNEVYTTLYYLDGTFVYGENPIPEESSEIKFVDSEIQTITVDGTIYYLFDRKLTGEGLEGLWLRGVVSEKQGNVQMETITRASLIVMPVFVIIAIVGGYIFASRTLRPIKDITEAAEQINEGSDLKKRIDIGEGSNELHLLADSYNRMFDRLEQSFNIEKQFTSDVSHELRTPMAVILAQCELALETEGTTEDYQEALQVIQRQGNKMNELINSMLDFTRLETSGERYVKEDFNLSELVEYTCLDMSLLREKNISLKYEVEEDVMFNGNRELLTRLITNLISNAYRYGKENGHIEVSLYKDNEKIKLAVKDDGIGISEENLDKIFHRFYQVDSARASESGNGLGLSMALEIAKFHGGTIEVDSELDQGSTFTVIL